MFRRIYYGWWIIGVAMLAVGAWFGTRAVFAVYFAALVEEFKWGRGPAAGVQSLAMLVYTVASPLVGLWVDRFGVRRVVVPGVLVFSLGFFLCAGIQGLAGFYLAFGLVVGLGVSALGLAPFTVLTARWFVRRRGLANGLVTTGMGLGLVAMLPLTQLALDLFGWRTAFALTGVAGLVLLLPATALVLRERPGDLGLAADGTPAPSIPATAPAAAPRPGKDSLKRLFSKRFYLFIGAASLNIVGIYVIMVHLVRFLGDRGVPPLTASLVMALVGLASSLSRVGWGFLLDRLSPESNFALGAGLTILGFLALLGLDAGGPVWLAWAFAGFYGLGWAALAPTLMTCVVLLFPGPRQGLACGVMEGTIGVGAALGGWLAGAIHDVTQSYALAFGLAIASTLASVYLLWLAAPRKGPDPA